MGSPVNGVGSRALKGQKMSHSGRADEQKGDSGVIAARCRSLASGIHLGWVTPGPRGQGE